MWALGTMCGIIVGNILPEVVTTALSVAVYGMFLAVVIPPCRKNKAVTAVVLSSFVISGLSKVIPVISDMSESVRVIVLTLVISVAAALLFPVKDEEGEAAQ